MLTFHCNKTCVIQKWERTLEFFFHLESKTSVRYSLRKISKKLQALLNRLMSAYLLFHKNTFVDLKEYSDAFITNIRYSNLEIYVSTYNGNLLING